MSRRSFLFFIYFPYMHISSKQENGRNFGDSREFFDFQFSQIFFSLVLESKLPLCNFVVASCRGVKVSLFIFFLSTQLVNFKRAKFFELKSHCFSSYFSFPFGFDKIFIFASEHLFCSTRSRPLFMFYQD